MESILNIILIIMVLVLLKRLGREEELMKEVTKKEQPINIKVEIPQIASSSTQNSETNSHHIPKKSSSSGEISMDKFKKTSSNEDSWLTKKVDEINL